MEGMERMFRGVGKLHERSLRRVGVDARRSAQRSTCLRDKMDAGKQEAKAVEQMDGWMWPRGRAMSLWMTGCRTRLHQARWISRVVSGIACRSCVRACVRASQKTLPVRIASCWSMAETCTSAAALGCYCPCRFPRACYSDTVTAMRSLCVVS